MLQYIKKIDFAITLLLSIDIIDGYEIDKLKIHSNELKAGLGLLNHNDETWSGKEIYWRDINFLKTQNQDQKKHF